MNDATTPKAAKIIIVEDHAVMRHGLSAALASFRTASEPTVAQIEVVGSAESADDGLRLCNELRPDLALLDLHLPDSTNASTLIKSFAAAVPHVLIFTAEGRRAYIEAALALPIAGYLMKSESIESIVDAIHRAIAGERPVLSAAFQNAHETLTPAEKSLLGLLAKGYKYDGIARLRATAPGTVKKQCERLLIKLDLCTREELISWAALHGYANFAD